MLQGKECGADEGTPTCPQHPTSSHRENCSEWRSRKCRTLAGWWCWDGLDLRGWTFVFPHSVREGLTPPSAQKFLYSRRLSLQCWQSRLTSRGRFPGYQQGAPQEDHPGPGWMIRQGMGCTRAATRPFPGPLSHPFHPPLAPETQKGPRHSLARLPGSAPSAQGQEEAGTGSSEPQQLGRWHHQDCDPGQGRWQLPMPARLGRRPGGGETLSPALNQE